MQRFHGICPPLKVGTFSHATSAQTPLPEPPPASPPSSPQAAPSKAAALAANTTAQTLTFTTYVGDEVTAGPGHPIRVERDPATAEPAPYVMVRRGLEALIDRKSFYRLAELGCEHEVGGILQFGVWSGGAFFPLIAAEELR